MRKKNKSAKQKMLIKKRGFMMVEAVFSIFITGIALVAFLNVLGVMYKTEFEKRDYVIATNLAQEEIELVRNVRDNNWKASGKAFDCPGNASGCYSFPKSGTLCIDYSAVHSTYCVAGGSNSLLYLNNDNFYTYDSTNNNQPTKFYRSFSLSGDDDSRTVKVDVTWNNNKIEISDTLYAWANSAQ
jgi:type II secretory pathway pseudopilin PulG